jgi:mannosyltransferase
MVLLVGVGWSAQTDIRRSASHMGPAFRAVARDVLENQQPGDVIVYGDLGTWSLRAGIDYQLRGKSKPRDVLLTKTSAEAGQLEAVQCTDEVACLNNARRVWFFRLVQTGEPELGSGPLIEAGGLKATLTTNYRQAGVWRETKGGLLLFVHK